MLLAFWLKNLSFAIELSGAITLILGSFLLFDTWTIKKEPKTGLQGAGYILLAFFFVISAAKVTFPSSEWILLIIKDLGLVLLLAGLLIDRLNPVPKLIAAIGFIPIYFVSPLLFIVITVLYLLKATKGYEKNLIWVSLAFGFFTLGDLVSSLSFLSNSNYQVLTAFYSLFGPAFYLQNCFNLAGIVVLFLWLLGYLRFRLLSQMFLYFSVGSLTIFLITTFAFTSFLLSNLEDSAKQNLTISGKSFQYSISQLQDKALLTSRSISTSDSIKAAIATGSRANIYNQITGFFFPTKGDSLIVTDPEGVIAATSEDKDQFGSSISGKAVIQQASKGFDSVKTISDNKNGLARLSVEAATPIKNNNKIVGVALATYSIDNFFVDNVKSVTGLDVTVYAGEVKSATTFLDPTSRKRPVGSKESNEEVTKAVLDQGKTVNTSKSIFGKEYSAVYLPIKNLDGKSVGMVFVGRLESEIIATAEKSINLTFLFTALLTLLSIVPSYFLAKFIAKHQEA